MKIVRIVSIVLLTALMLPAAACRKPGDPAQTADETETTAPEITAVDLADYAVIRPDKTSDAVKEAASTLVKKMQSRFGDQTKINTDWVRRPEDIPAEGKEILVGVTNRPESIEAAADLREQDYVIRYFPASGRIVIAGGGDDVLMEAVEKFMEDYLTTAETDGRYTVPASLDVCVRGQYDVSALTLCGKRIEEYTVVLPKSADRDEKYAAELITGAVRAATGISLASVSEADAPADGRILIGKTGLTPADCILSGADAGWICGTADAGIIVAGDGGMTVRAAREFVSAVVPAGCSGERTVDLPAAAAVPREKAAYSAPPELGEKPVALTDQKNAVAAVYDLAPALTVGQAKLVWTFAPTTANGFSTSGYGNRIDEAKLRYSTVLGKYVILVTSSSGFVGVGEYPSGSCVWCGNLSGYGPHSIEYLPNGNVALALSGNGTEEKSFIRVYAASQGKNNMKCASARIESAHAVLWDDVRGILWALGSKTVTAYEVGGTDAVPTLTRLSVYDATASMGGHDMAPVLGDTDKLWLSGSSVFVFDKTLGTIQKYEPLSVSGSTKSIGTFPDGTAVRAVATNVFASHDTDQLVIFTPGAAPDTFSGLTLTFAPEDRAFYKARIFLPFYS